jgi:hypothetical protein
VALALALVPATASAAPTTTGTLYVQQAANAQLVGAGSAWKLVLDRPDAHVIAFADRPARTGTAQRLSTFVRGWDAAFGGDPPNAALQVEGAPPSRDIALLELSAPRLSRGGHRLIYRARPLTATSATLGGLAKRADRGIKGRLGRVTLFIDDGSSATGVVSVQATGVAPGMLVQFNLPDNTFAVSAGVTTTTDTLSQWGVGISTLTFQCNATSPCNGSATAVVNAPPSQPLNALFIINSGAMSGSWSGGAVQSFAAPGAQVPLPPGS